MINSHFQRSRGFGFITFSSPDCVERVLAVPSHSLDGKKIDPKHATPKSKSKANKTKKIFVGGVSQETSADEVKAYFSQFGKVEEAVMLMDQQTKRHRGFGFVTFENEDVVDRVCEIHFHTIKNKKVECKKAQPKEAVQAANTAALLGKRVILSNLGIPTAALQSAAGVPSLPAAAISAGLPGLIPQTPSMAALAAAQNQAAALGYGKLMQAVQSNGAPGGTVVSSANTHGGGGGGGPQPAGLPTALSSFRYAPYPMPVSAAALSASQAVHQALAAQQQVAVAQQQHTHQNAPQQPHQQQHSQQQPPTQQPGQQTAASQQAASQQTTQQQPSNAAVATAAQLSALAAASGQTSLPGVSLGALASTQALQTFAQSGAHAAVIPSVTASGGLAAPGLANNPAAATAPNVAAAAAAAAAAAGNPYSGYSLTNVDMSSFQGVDWSSIYGMGMYV